MRVQRVQHYPLAADELLAVLTDRDFFLARHAMSGIADVHFDVFAEQRDGLLIRMLRDIDIPLEKVPSFARRFLSSRATLVQEFLWYQRQQQPFRARYRFALGKVPVEVRGEVLLRDHQQGAEQQLKVEVNSSLPLIGSKLAALVGERVDRALDSDYRATLRYLRERGMVDADWLPSAHC